MDKETREAEKKLRQRRRYGKKLQQEQQEQKRKRQLENQMHQEYLRLKKKQLKLEHGSRPKSRPAEEETDETVFGKTPQTPQEHLAMRRAVYDRYKRKLFNAKI